MVAMDNPLVELRNVSKQYDPPQGPRVLRGVTVQLAAGRSLAVVGPSGCGKSTLLNLIAAMDAPTAGQVLIDGEDLAALNEPQRAALRARKIGMVFQLHHLLPQLSVMQNVLTPVLAAAGDMDKAAARAADLLQRVGLGERMNYSPAKLSGGERQRAALVRALINSPRLLLADEPTGSLDRAAADSLADLLAELQAEGLAMIVVTHWPALASRMQAVMQLSDGALAKE